jgi:hypothetical protein
LIEIFGSYILGRRGAVAIKCEQAGLLFIPVAGRGIERCPGFIKTLDFDTTMWQLADRSAVSSRSVPYLLW